MGPRSEKLTPALNTDHQITNTQQRATTLAYPTSYNKPYQVNNMHLHVGMGGYVAIGLDRMACTVVQIKRRNREVVIQYDFAHPVWNDACMDDQGNINPWYQEYTFERNPKGRMETFSLRRKDHFWYRKGELSGPSVARLYMGERLEWSEPSGLDKEMGQFTFLGMGSVGC